MWHWRFVGNQILVVGNETKLSLCIIQFWLVNYRCLCNPSHEMDSRQKTCFATKLLSISPVVLSNCHLRCSKENIWVFPKIVVPQNGWFIMENSIKIDDLGGKPPIFGNIHIELFSGPVYSSLREPVGRTRLYPIQRIYINASVATKGLDALFFQEWAPGRYFLCKTTNFHFIWRVSYVCYM